jgi:PKD repeat protein
MRTCRLSKANLLLMLPVFVILCSCNKGTDDATTVAGFTYTSTASVPATVQFVNTSTTSGGSSVFTWDFGDGTTAQIINATHVYTQYGVFPVKLIQTPSAGAADSVMQLLNLSPIIGPAGISNRLHGQQSASFTFSIARAYTATFINSSLNASSYLWKFGDGVTTTTDSATVVHTYLTGGTYHVNLTATGSNDTDTSGATIVF